MRQRTAAWACHAASPPSEPTRAAHDGGVRSRTAQRVVCRRDALLLLLAAALRQAAGDTTYRIVTSGYCADTAGTPRLMHERARAHADTQPPPSPLSPSRGPELCTPSP